MAETREQKKARLEREGWRQVKGDRFVKANPTEHASTDSIMKQHYDAGDAMVDQMVTGNTPGGNK